MQYNKKNFNTLLLISIALIFVFGLIIAFLIDNNNNKIKELKVEQWYKDHPTIESAKEWNQIEEYRTNINNEYTRRSIIAAAILIASLGILLHGPPLTVHITNSYSENEETEEKKKKNKRNKR